MVQSDTLTLVQCILSRNTAWCMAVLSCCPVGPWVPSRSMVGRGHHLQQRRSVYTFARTFLTRQFGCHQVQHSDDMLRKSERVACVSHTCCHCCRWCLASSSLMSLSECGTNVFVHTHDACMCGILVYKVYMCGFLNKPCHQFS